MPIEDRGDAHVITHALAQHTISELRSTDTGQVEFRNGLVELGRLCGFEIIDGMMDTEYVSITTPLSETTGEVVKGLEDVVIVNVLRAATPFVEGLVEAFPRARQGVISAGRDEEAGMNDEGEFPTPSSSRIRCSRPGVRSSPFSRRCSGPARPNSSSSSPRSQRRRDSSGSRRSSRAPTS
jgi:hypothetical protein